jgi:hypothetical protein
LPANILYVNHSGRVSGAETSLLATLERMDHARFSPAVACPPGELAARLGEIDVPHFAASLGRIKRTRNPFGLAT